MKIVFIGGRDIHILGGIENYMLNLTRELTRLGHECVVWCESDHREVKMLDGVKVIYHPGPKSNLICKPWCGLKATLRTLFREKNVSVIHYNASANDLKNYTVDGNEENELMNEFRKQTNGMNPAQQREVAETFINDHPESAVAIYLFDRYLVQEQSTSLETLKKTIKTLKKAQPQNRLVLKVENTMKLIENGQVGKTIPSIELKTKSKRTINIGKTNVDYTVLVYWSTWMPDRYDFVDDFAVLTEDYADYTNVKIIAISLDSEIFKWENTTREDTTYCEHVCDGKVWDSEPVKKLGITSIPTFIIADKNHKIVARGSSVDELDRELQKLVD